MEHGALAQPQGNPRRMKTLSLVKFRDGLSREDAWRAWAEHTRRWDSKDHPEIRMTRLTLFGAGGDPGADAWKLSFHLDKPTKVGPERASEASGGLARRQRRARERRRCVHPPSISRR